MAEAVEEAVRAIIQAVRGIGAHASELAADIMDKGIILTGGGSILRGLTNRIAAETDIPWNWLKTPFQRWPLAPAEFLRIWSACDKCMCWSAG